MVLLFLSFVALGALIGYLLIVKPRRDAAGGAGPRTGRPGRGPRPAPKPPVKGPDDDEEFQRLLRRRVAEQRRRDGRGSEGPVAG